MTLKTEIMGYQDFSGEAISKQDKEFAKEFENFVNGRMCFAEITGRELSRAHRYLQQQMFKVFIGYKNMVCCNLCVSTDGYKAELKAQTTHDLFLSALELFQHYSMAKHLSHMEAVQDCHLTAHQFAQFIGKCRLYQNLPNEQKKIQPPLLMTDTQIGMVAKSFYQDENFSIKGQGEGISLWNVYNLLTGANKSSYIDNFLDRAYNATQLAEGLNKALHGECEYSWFVR